MQFLEYNYQVSFMCAGVLWKCPFNKAVVIILYVHPSYFPPHSAHGKDHPNYFPSYSAHGKSTAHAINFTRYASPPSLS